MCVAGDGVGGAVFTGEPDVVGEQAEGEDDVCFAGGCVGDVEAASASHVFAVGDGVCGVEFTLAHECAAFVRGEDCVH